MANKLTVKQEKFAQKYIELGNASEAYRQSYDCEKSSDEVIWQEACILLGHPKVSVRVAELQAEHKEQHKVTVESLVKELEEARALAMKNDQTTASVSATMGKAKIHGFLTEKVENRFTDENGNDRDPLIVVLPAKDGD